MGSPVRQPLIDNKLDSTPAGAIPSDLQFVPHVTSPLEHGEIPGGSQERTLPSPKE